MCASRKDEKPQPTAADDTISLADEITEVSRGHFEAIVESLDAVIWEFEADTLRSTYVSPQLEQLTGYTVEDAARDPQLWRHLVHEDDREETLRICSASVPTRSAFELCYRIRTRDERVRWVKDITTVIRDERGEPDCLRCILLDVTEQHEAHERAKADRRRLQEAQRIANLGDWEWNLHTGALSWSEQCFRIFGMQPQSGDLTYHSYTELLPPAAARLVEQAVERTLRDDEPFVIDHYLTRADGSVAIIYAEGELVEDADGNPLYLRGTIQDVTERKEFDRLKDEFIALVSHELRTPMTPLVGILSVLEEHAERGDDPQLKRMVHLAYRNSKRLAQLVDDLLDIQMLTSTGDASLEVEPVDLSALVEETVAENRHLATQNQLTVECSVPDQPLLVQGNRPRLKQVIRHLLSNAAKFSPPGSVVRVRAERDEAGARCSVIDNGPGIPEDFQERVFDTFAQAENPVTRMHDGAGLGLAICRKIIGELDGSIHFENTDGRGSIFYFILPLAESNTADA